MKIKFTKLTTPSETIQISFDGGSTYKTYNVDDCKADGVSFTEEDCPDLTKIVIKGKFKSFSDSIDVVKNLTGSGDAYPTLEIIPALGYSGNAQFQIVNEDDDTVKTIVAMLNNSNDLENMYSDESMNTHLAYTDFSKLPSGDIYYGVYEDGLSVRIAKFICDTTSKIPVTYYTVEANGCGSYGLSSHSSSLTIESQLKKDSSEIYLPLGKDLTISVSSSYYNKFKLIEDIYYLSLSDLEGTLYDYGIYSAYACTVLRNMDGVSFYTYNADNDTMEETKYYLDLGLASSAIDGWYIYAGGSGGYSLSNTDTSTECKLLGVSYINDIYVTTNPGVTINGGDYNSTTVDGVVYYPLHCNYIVDPQGILDLSGSEIYINADGSMIDTGCTVGNINGLSEE